MTPFYRRCIRIRAEDSPNVQLAQEELRRGLPVSGTVVVPGVLSHAEYVHRRATFSPQEQCEKLDAAWYEGAEIMLFPAEWLNRAEGRARQLEGTRRFARAIGVDSAEGGDKTAWAVVDERGLIKLRAEKTPNTAVVTGVTLGLMREHDVPPEKVCFDRGGGGKEHADRLRSQGYAVKTVAFGEAVVLDPRRVQYQLKDRLENREERYVYVNRRAEMYHSLSLMLDPTSPEYKDGWGIPAVYTELRHQLSKMPKLHDPEGRLFMLPKTKKPGDESDKDTLVRRVGHSPDEADAVVVAVHQMTTRSYRAAAGAMR